MVSPSAAAGPRTAAAELLLKAVADTGHMLSPGVRPLLGSAAPAISPGSSNMTLLLRPCLVPIQLGKSGSLCPKGHARCSHMPSCPTLFWCAAGTDDRAPPEKSEVDGLGLQGWHGLALNLPCARNDRFPDPLSGIKLLPGRAVQRSPGTCRRSHLAALMARVTGAHAFSGFGGPVLVLCLLQVCQV